MIVPLHTILQAQGKASGSNRIDASPGPWRTRALEILESAEAILTKEANRRFDRYVGVLNLNDPRRVLRDGSVIHLREDLMQLTEVLDSNGSPRPLINYTPGSLNNVRGPYRRIQTSESWGSIKSISGEWGYGGRWLPSGITLNDPMDTTSQTISVDDSVFASGINETSLIQIADEILYVSEIRENGAAWELEVVRGFNGTVPENHPAGASLHYFEGDPVARRVIIRLHTWISQLEQSPLYQVVSIGDMSQLLDISTAPADIRATIELLRPSSWIPAV